MRIQVSEGSIDSKEEAPVGTFDLDYFLTLNEEALDGERDELLAALAKGEAYRILGGVGTWHTVREA